jgi:hypothetical protein
LCERERLRRVRHEPIAKEHLAAVANFTEEDVLREISPTFSPDQFDDTSGVRRRQQHVRPVDADDNVAFCVAFAPAPLCVVVNRRASEVYHPRRETDGFSGIAQPGDGEIEGRPLAPERFRQRNHKFVLPS